MSEERNWEFRKTTIAGFTKKMRIEELEKIEKKMRAKSWEYVEYHDDGMSGSYAKFRRQIDVSDKPRSGVSTGGTVAIMGGLGGLIVFAFMFGGSPEHSSEMDYFQATLEEGKNIGRSAKEENVKKFLVENSIERKHYSKFSDCISEFLYTKSNTLKVNEVAGWCLREFKANNGKFKRAYINLDGLRYQFKPWTGSHLKLEESIKKAMNDEDSYKHLETTYRLVLHSKTEQPHMVVRTNYSGKNMYGGRVKETVLAKVDIKTGTVLEILEHI